jgi:4-aminobutyrate aminotransferase/(S)-3-amino-2-methylpropionate transaminase
VARGEGSVIEDVDGNRFLDLAAGICVNALGHSHPRYRQMLKDQIDEVTVGSLTSPRRAEALKKVAAHTPPGLDKIQLYSGGTEAVEAAMRLAKSHTKKYEFLSFWGGFHGKTAGSLSLIGDGTKNGLGPSMPGTFHTPYADCYRCPLGLQYPSCGVACAEFASKVIRHSTTGALAAILIEPIQGTAGNIVPPPGFLAAVCGIAREHGALVIADEMITGFGRTGLMFGCNHDGVVPDIMTMGKGMASGFPVSALLSTDAIVAAEPFSLPSASSSSYGGNPLAAAAALVTIRTICDEGLVDNAARVGRTLLEGLRALEAEHPSIANVRGKGLLIGFDLVRPKRDATGKSELAFMPKDGCVEFFKECLANGLILMGYTPRVRLHPPLVLSADEATRALAIIGGALQRLE